MRGVRGEDHHSSILEDGDISMLRELFDIQTGLQKEKQELQERIKEITKELKRLSIGALADKYDISYSTMSKLKCGITWNHI